MGCPRLSKCAPTPSCAYVNPQAGSFKLNPLNSLSCRKMTIQRLKNLRLMTQRYLVLAVVGGWMRIRHFNMWLSSYVWSRSVPLTHCATTCKRSGRKSVARRTLEATLEGVSPGAAWTSGLVGSAALQPREPPCARPGVLCGSLLPQGGTCGGASRGRKHEGPLVSSGFSSVVQTGRRV